MTHIPYEDLDKSFFVPKSGLSMDYKRIPRKFKKKWKHILSKDKYTFLSFNQKLWYIQSIINPNYTSFLIKTLINE